MSSPAKTLIDNAAKMCGSEAELARRIGTSPAALSHLKHGNREMSPETAALLADIAHMDAREAVIQAVIERNKTGPKAEQIREILGKALAAGVAAVLVFSYADLQIFAMESAASELTILHIVSSSLLALMMGHALRKRRHGGLRPHTPSPRKRVPRLSTSKMSEWRLTNETTCRSEHGRSWSAITTAGAPGHIASAGELIGL